MAVVKFRSRRSRAALGNWLLLPLALAVGALGGASINSMPSLSSLLLPAESSGHLVAARSFPLCAGGARVTCVVDGDTFWLDGTKIRIADINTPEVGKPACAAEAALGGKATMRLAQLLREGPFELVSIDRDEDVYGRKLRVVQRGGASIGDTLVDEGLAHTWRGHQEDWCSSRREFPRDFRRVLLTTNSSLSAHSSNVAEIAGIYVHLRSQMG